MAKVKKIVEYVVYLPNNYNELYNIKDERSLQFYLEDSKTIDTYYKDSLREARNILKAERQSFKDFLSNIAIDEDFKEAAIETFINLSYIIKVTTIEERI